MSKIPVGILGATGAVGQMYARLLENHPLFEIAAISASPKWEGKPFKQALSDRMRFSLSEKTLNFPLKPMSPLPVIFSALRDQVAQSIEYQLASQGSAVFSHASIHRKADDIPLVIPEINPSHLALIPFQQKKRKWKGFIVAKPNCTLQSFLLPLFPLHQSFELKQALITTMQSISGAGGTFVLEKNILPYIEGEEEKSETEPLKILGALKDGKINPASITFSAHCNRVPVSEGHLACISATFAKPINEEKVRLLWKNFPTLSLPSAPKKPFHYFEEKNRPQPLLDKDLEKGMGIAIGRLRTCSIFDLRFTALSHNLIRGASGGSLLSAELAYQEGYLDG